MSRMYSRKKGKSRSHRPQKPKASWVKYKPEEIRLLISEKIELPYLGEDDNGKILYLPKPVKKKNGFTL